MTSRGYELYRTDNHVCIVTLHSENTKTGDMVQTWFLGTEQPPHTAQQTGQDSVVCLDCPQRPIVGGACYVVTVRGPRSIWHAWRAGRYPRLPLAEYNRVFAGRKVRLSAYGEPVLMPLPLLQSVVQSATGWTGYTHQWAKAAYQDYRPYLMASVDSWTEYRHAKSLGWRTFRASRHVDPSPVSEITCPASDEAGHRTQCVRCGLCDGVKGAADPRKDITIRIHGAKAARLIQLGKG
jgi:hypothetical protein